jgi:hypothetical protein
MDDHISLYLRAVGAGGGSWKGAGENVGVADLDVEVEGGGLEELPVTVLAGAGRPLGLHSLEGM